LSLTTSPTKENEPVFFSHGSHIHSYFICSPFFLVHEEIKNNNPELFPHGFDIIIEDTTFQMYSPDREQQIKHVKNIKRRWYFHFHREIFHLHKRISD
ncbi:TPA: hypothetical protein ACUKVQ_005345, partial [Escherichia coli]